MSITPDCLCSWQTEEDYIDALLELVDLVWMACGCPEQPPS